MRYYLRYILTGLCLIKIFFQTFIRSWIILVSSNIFYKISTTFNMSEKWQTKSDKIIIITSWNVFVFGVFLVRIFLHSDWIRRVTPYLSVFSLIAGKYGPEKLGIWTLIMQWILVKQVNKWRWRNYSNVVSKVCYVCFKCQCNLF